MNRFTESVVEDAALEWLGDLGYAVVAGPDIAPGEPAAERADFAQVVLEERLRAALSRLNPDLPADALEEAFRRLTRADAPSLILRNRAVHRMLVDGVNVEYQRRDGSIAGAQARVIDFDDVDANDWLAVNQFTVVENRRNRRPDVVLFVNGLPLVVIELKNAADESATIWGAFDQLQTYKAEIPSIFAFNAALVISDGTAARIGTLNADRERFMPWRATAGGAPAGKGITELQVMLDGVFDRRRLLAMLRHFIVFEADGSAEPTKKMAGYHQFHAVNVAIEETLRATEAGARRPMPDGGAVHDMGRARAGGAYGDHRVGVVWHTQGSGKSLTMAFYAGRVIAEPAMGNPTVVVLTDRNDLDDQLFGTFGRCQEILRQAPVQATDRADLREKLRVEVGGVVFTTIQKFFPDEKGDRHPLLSDRRNIVVIADEAHRTQYAFLGGFARHVRDALPNASFIGFTGTPVELTDKNTRAVFGDYISVYDIKDAVVDGATVPIYYESRLAKLELKESERPRLDPDFDEVTEGEEVERKEKLKSRWAQLEALVGTEKRVGLIADDLIHHFEARLEVMDGKAMIVCMSRRICVELYRALAALRPAWAGSDETGALKVVMTGSATDPVEWQQHIGNKLRREALAKRFRDPADPLRIVIVRDMWLTGFDAPCLHTMYVDKPMRGHGLMQAIARVNRVFKDKPGGLIVDYLGLADELKAALATYTESQGHGRPTLDQAEAVALMQEKHEVCCGLFHGFDWSRWASGKATERLTVLGAGQEHILAQKDGKPRLLTAVKDLSQAFALAVPAAEALALRGDVAFFQAVRAALGKGDPDKTRSDDDMNHAIRQLVSGAVATDGVVDIFAAAGLKKPDISILSDEFLTEVRGLPHKNLAVELLRKLLAGEIKNRARKNVVQARSFSEMLDQAIRRYQNRAIETAKVIEELIALAKDMKNAADRGGQLGLTDAELAFYDALETNDSSVKVLGDEALRMIARELVAAVRANTTIDWTIRESARAGMRVLVKRILKKHGYPPDKQEKATLTVLEQAQLLCAEVVE